MNERLDALRVRRDRDSADQWRTTLLEVGLLGEKYADVRAAFRALEEEEARVTELSHPLGVLTGTPPPLAWGVVIGLFGLPLLGFRAQALVLGTWVLGGLGLVGIIAVAVAAHRRERALASARTRRLECAQELRRAAELALE